MSPNAQLSNLSGDTGSFSTANFATSTFSTGTLSSSVLENDRFTDDTNNLNEIPEGSMIVWENSSGFQVYGTIAYVDENNITRK